MFSRYLWCWREEIWWHATGSGCWYTKWSWKPSMKNWFKKSTRNTQEKWVKFAFTNDINRDRQWCSDIFYRDVLQYELVVSVSWILFLEIFSYARIWSKLSFVPRGFLLSNLRSLIQPILVTARSSWLLQGCDGDDACFNLSHAGGTYITCWWYPYHMLVVPNACLLQRSTWCKVVKSVQVKWYSGFIFTVVQWLHL